MMSDVELLKSQAEQLSVPERADLALFLLHSLELQEPVAEAAWKTEIDRRVSEIRSGAVAARPLDDILADLRLRYP